MDFVEGSVLQIALHVISGHPRSPSETKSFSCIISQHKERNATSETAEIIEELLGELLGVLVSESIVEVAAKKVEANADASGAQSERKNGGELKSGLGSVLGPPIGSGHLPESPP